MRSAAAISSAFQVGVDVVGRDRIKDNCDREYILWKQICSVTTEQFEIVHFSSPRFESASQGMLDLHLNGSSIVLQYNLNSAYRVG
ncbi:Oosporein cluster regulator [Dirofilaria immitis]